MTAPQTSTETFRWVMFAGMVGVYFAFGVMVVSIPPMITEVRTDLGMSRGAMGLALSAWTLVYIGTSALAGRAVDRIGIKWAIGLGGLSLALSGFARSFATGTTSLWLAVAIMGIGGPLISSAAPTLCAQWFDDDKERRFALSIYNLGPGLGSVAALYATNSLLLPWLGDWRAVLRFEALLATALTIAWVAVGFIAPAGNHTSRKEATPLLHEWAGLFRSPDVRVMLMLGTLTFFVGHSMNNWMVDALSTGADITEDAASIWVGTGGLIGMALLFVGPLLVRRLGSSRVLVISWAAIITGLLMVAFGPPWLAPAGALVTACRTLMIPVIITTLISARGVNESNIGTANGLWFAFAQVGSVIGPWLFGTIADGSGGFPAALSMLCAVGAATALLVHVRLEPAAPLGQPA